MNASSISETGVPDALEPAPPGKFTQGSILRHVLVMTSTSTIGLMAIFIVDFLNLLYISWLRNETLTAAVGYASVIGFFLISVCIGFMIAVSALVSRALGARDRSTAQEIAGSGMIYVGAVMAALAALAMILCEPLLTLLGAQGETYIQSYYLLMFTLPSIPLIGIGIAQMAILRAAGSANLAMWVTLGSGLFTAFMDPLLIFVLGYGLNGAAFVVIFSRFILVAIGSYGVFYAHRLSAMPTRRSLTAHISALNGIAIPAVLTNIATPVASGYVTSAMAQFGDAGVAAWAIVSRLIPLAFGATFALSGAVGPILGQNLGARIFSRLHATMCYSLLLVAVYVLTVWGLLYVAQDKLVYLFSLSGEAAMLLRYYCTFIAGTFIFMGALFTANAAFNNLGFPLLSTFFNWSRATLGTIPFVYVFGRMYGAKGVLLGQGLGAVLFGIGAIVTGFYVVRRLERLSLKAR